MGKQLKKKPAPRRKRYGLVEVLRVIQQPINVGFNPKEHLPKPRPISFWFQGEVYSILHIIKEWKDEWHNRYVRVITDKGAFDIYEHRKVISITDKKYEYYWRLDKELKLPK